MYSIIFSEQNKFDQSITDTFVCLTNKTIFLFFRMLSATELRRVTEIFTRMFMDAHTKVFTLFLDTLTELVVSHKADLGDWLYVLLTRLLNKLGADLLGSIIQKINRTLEVVR